MTSLMIDLNRIIPADITFPIISHRESNAEVKLMLIGTANYDISVTTLHASVIQIIKLVKQE